MSEPLLCPKCRFEPTRGEAGDRCPHDGAVLVLKRHWEARPTDPMFGRVLGGKYAVVGLVGEGGFGSVYRAIQEPVGRPVAVKCLAENQQRNEDLRQRFFREARVVARLNHPSTVVLHDYGEEADGRLFMVFELVEGASLVDVLRHDAPLAPCRAILLLRGVLGALSEAHSLGLVHRDLKPSNIMVVRGSFGDEDVKVLDFGIAKVISGEAHKDRLRTRQGLVLGTPHYMAPEQARGDDVDVRSDLYSVGVLLFEALSGKPPFDAPSDIAVLMAQIQQPIPKLPPELDVPAPLLAVVEKALQKKPADRFQTAEEFATALLRSVDGLFGTLHPPAAESTEPSPTTVMATARKSQPVEAPAPDQTSTEMPALAMAFEETPAVDPDTGQSPPLAVAVPQAEPAEFGNDFTEQVDLPAERAEAVDPRRPERDSGQLQGERISREVPAPKKRGGAIAAAMVTIVAGGAASAWWLMQRESRVDDRTPVVVGVTIAPPDAAPPPENTPDAPPLPKEPYARAVELARRQELEAAELALLDAFAAVDDAARAELAKRVRGDNSLRDLVARPAVQAALTNAEKLP
jgi:serine/threonine-protein kinase